MTTQKAQAKKLRTVENLILFTFVIVLFAGCAGSDIKQATDEQAQSVFSESEMPESYYVTPASDIPNIPVTKSENNIKPLVQSDVQQPVEPTIDVFTKEPVDLATDDMLTLNSVKLTTPETKIFYFDTNDHTLSAEQRNTLKEHAAHRP